MAHAETARIVMEAAYEKLIGRKKRLRAKKQNNAVSY